MIGVLSLFFWSVALQIITCPPPSSEGACVSSNLKFYATVGTGLAPVRQRLPCKGSSRFLETKNDWGILQNHIKSTLQSLRVAYGNPPPFTQGRLDMRLSVNVNLYVIYCGQGRALSAKGSLVKGAVVFLETKKWLRDFTKSYKINLTIPPSCLRQPTSLYTREAGYAVVRECEFICNLLRTGASPVRQRLPCKGSCRFFGNKKMTEGFYKII